MQPSLVPHCLRPKPCPPFPLLPAPSPILSNLPPPLQTISKLMLVSSICLCERERQGGTGGVGWERVVSTLLGSSSGGILAENVCPKLKQNLILIFTEPHSSGMRGSVSSDVSAASPQSSSSHSPSPPSTSSSDRKAATLYLTDEEKRLLAAEGVTLPTDMPLTKVSCRSNAETQQPVVTHL